MGALEEARARALRSIKLKATGTAAGSAAAAAAPSASDTAAASTAATASSAAASAAIPSNEPSAAPSIAAAPSDPPGPRKPRKRRFLDAPPEDAAVLYAATPTAQPALPSIVAPAASPAATVATVAVAPASALPSIFGASAPSPGDTLMSSADSRPPTPAAAADSTAPAAAVTADATAAAAPAAPTTKRSRWGGVPKAATTAAAAAGSTHSASSAMVAGAPFPNASLALLPPSSAASSALSSAPVPAPPIVADPSTAMVPLGGGGGASPSSASSACGGGGGGAGTVASRKSRFSSEAVSLSFDHSLLLSYHPPSTLPRNLQLHVACAGMTTAQADAFLTHYRLETMEAQLRALAAGRPLDEVDPQPIDPATRQPRERSPSPEPVYDSQGVRTNTRTARLRLRLLQTQKRLVADTLSRTPGGEFTPPRGFRSSAAARLKFEAQRLVPLDLYPDYNFKGVIIGARGDNQKELEKRTGCKIAVRGKGSWSDSRPDSVRKHWPDDDAPQYISIVADTEENLARGIAEVEKLLVPMNDEQRRKSLQALAEKNGWLSAPGEEYGVRACRVCGSREHLMKSCPERNNGRGYTTAAGVSCRLCGSRSHPTLDCHQAKGMSREALAAKLRGAPGAGGGTGKAMKDADERVDEEYEQFMNELLGEGSAASSSSSSGSGSGSGALFSSVARGSNGAQLALLPPTSREEAALVSLQQHQAKTAAPSYREYTPAQAQQEQAQKQALPPVLHAPVHSSHNGNGWSTTTFASTAAPHAPPPPPRAYVPVAPAYLPFAPPVHAMYDARLHPPAYAPPAPYPPPLPQPHYL